MPRSRLLFAARVHFEPLEVDANALAAAAAAGYARCRRALRSDELQTLLPGGAHTAANMHFFKKQVEHARKTQYHEHIDELEQEPAFKELQLKMRTAAGRYLEAHAGHSGEEARQAAQDAPLFCWASVHIGGSTHPPHVHSDACATGTFYAAAPSGSAPLLLEDPRGRSPFDVIVGIESRLRYGSAGSGGEATPPFDQPVHVEPRVGELIVFPPWLVHGVPPTTPEGTVRVSFSFNLLGGWNKTVTPLEH